MSSQTSSVTGSLPLREPGRRKRARASPLSGALPLLASIGPAGLFISLFLVVPCLVLLYLSFRAGHTPHYSLQNYATIFRSVVYRNSLLHTLYLGVMVTAITLIVGYPIAFFIARSRSRFVPIVTGAIVLPLFVSVVVRGFGWMILLGRTGPISALLTATGLASPSFQILYTESAVAIGLVQIEAPLMILPIASVLHGADAAIEEAALSLGASRLAVLRTVTLPLSLPGVAVGCVLVLAHVIAAFVLPALLASSSATLASTMIYQQVLVTGNAGLGAALAIVLVAATFLLLGSAKALTAWKAS